MTNCIPCILPDASSPAVNTREWLRHVLSSYNHIDTVRPHQLDHGMDLVNGKDVFLVIATGMGKTTVLLAPLQAAHARQEKGIGLLIVPTKVLVEQQAHIASASGLRALAIHEDTVREAKLDGRDLFTELSTGSDVRLAVMSPQMLRSSRMLLLLKSTKFKDLIRWMLVDEAHLVDETSGTFLQVYRNIATMRAILSSRTTWAAVTGTATVARALVMAKTLGFQPGHYVNARYSINRPTLSYIPRFFQHAISGNEFLDLSFLVPFSMNSVHEIPRTLVFATTIDLGCRIMQYLDNLIPPFFPQRMEVIKLYNSIKPSSYRRKFIKDIEDGALLRIGIVTDTCTYGMDIGNIRRVIIMDICPSHSNMKQKIGRAGSGL